MAPTAATKARTNKATAATAEAPAEEVTAPDAAAPKQESESQKRNRLRNEAERVIINRHKAEFEDVATELFAKNGLKFNKRMNEAEKAKAKVEELIAKHPELKDALLASLVPAQEVQAPTYDPAPQEFEGADYSEDTFAGEPDPQDPWAGHGASR